MTRYIISFANRHAISVSFSILLSMLANYFLFTNPGYWMVLSAILISPATRGTTFRQGIFLLFSIIVAILVSAFLVTHIQSFLLLELIIAIIFIFAASYAFTNRFLPTKNFLIGIVVIFVLLLETFAPVSPTYTLPSRIYHVVIGSLINIFVSQFVFPIKIEAEFKLGIIPTLYAIKHYLHGLSDCFVKSEHDLNLLSARRTQLENTLQGKTSIYPIWVYEVGFNPGLRAGFRFFLINTEKICEVLFSMSDLVRRQRQSALPDELISVVKAVTNKNILILEILIEFFEKGKLSTKEIDFHKDIAMLEIELKRLIPGNLEVLDLLPDYATLIAFVRDLKDMRKLLLQLLMSVTHGRKR